MKAEDARLTITPPVGYSARARPRRLGERRSKRLLHPECPSRPGIEGLDESHAIRCVQDSVHHDRGRTEILPWSQIRKLPRQRRIQRRARPQDLESLDVVRVNQIDWRIPVKTL